MPDAIVDAHYNASINGITDAYFAAGRAEKLITSDTTFQAACENTHAIIVDPPRDGLHPDVVQFLIKLRKDKAYKLLYISCNPVTLARDIAVLSEVFSVRTLQAVDMFPHTHHIETICLLS